MCCRVASRFCSLFCSLAFFGWSKTASDFLLPKHHCFHNSRRHDHFHSLRDGDITGGSSRTRKEKASVGVTRFGCVSGVQVWSERPTTCWLGVLRRRAVSAPVLFMFRILSASLSRSSMRNYFVDVKSCMSLSICVHILLNSFGRLSDDV